MTQFNDHMRESLQAFSRQCEAARNCGGIAKRDAMDGTPVPDGWVYDPLTCYYLPPNVLLLRP